MVVSRLELLARTRRVWVRVRDAEMDLAKLVHQGIDEVGACVAQEFSAHAQTCVAIAVCEAPGAERDHDRQDLDASFGQ